LVDTALEIGLIDGGVEISAEAPFPLRAHSLALFIHREAI